MEPELNLYYVQDDDRPMHVLAESMEQALDKWKRLVVEENPPDTMETVTPPDGVCLIAVYGEIIR